MSRLSVTARTMLKFLLVLLQCFLMWEGKCFENEEQINFIFSRHFIQYSGTVGLTHRCAESKPNASIVPKRTKATVFNMESGVDFNSIIISSISFWGFGIFKALFFQSCMVLVTKFSFGKTKLLYLNDTCGLLQSALSELT